MVNDSNLQAYWIGYSDDYWYSDEEDLGFDEDFSYESSRDMELEYELY